MILRNKNIRSMKFLLSPILIILFFLNGCQSDHIDGVDYTVTQADFSAEFKVGESVIIDFTVKNQGTEDDNKGYLVKLFAHSHYILDSETAVYIDEISNKRGLAGGKESEENISFTVPADVPSQCYFFLKIESQANEIENSNNIVSSNLIAIPGGSVSRSQIPVDNIFHEYSIHALSSLYFYFTAQVDHEYEISWDDYYDGSDYIDVGADIKVTLSTADDSTTFYSEVDDGYSTPLIISAPTDGDIYIDVKASSLYGEFGIQISDLGIP